MFRFLTDEVNANDGNELINKSETSSTASEISWKESKELTITDESFQISKEVPWSEYHVGQLEIKYILISMLLKSDFIKDNDNVKSLLQSTSDLNSGVYEGGFKIWECTYDLIQYIHESPDNVTFSESIRVLDLGCGSGLLGMYALSRGAGGVHFQDYNSEVLNFVTIPNTMLNYDDNTVSKCRFFCGDWDSLRKQMESSENGEKEFKYDYILTSETIYNIDNLQKLFTLIKSRLKPDGKLLLAAKTFYFGVGGGTKAFKSLIDEDLSMNWKVVKAIREGVQREIIEVTFKA